MLAMALEKQRNYPRLATLFPEMDSIPQLIALSCLVSYQTLQVRATGIVIFFILILL
jgi:hypothetical protein